MSSVSPILTSIRTLADPAIWERSVALADAGLPTLTGRIRPNEISRIYFVGCGTSYYAGQVARYFVEQLAQIPAQAVQAYEFAAYAEPAILGRDTLVVAVSQSGDTEAAANALGRARGAGSRTLAVTATAGSLVTQVAEATVLTGGEADTPPAKTSSYVQSLVSLWMLAHYLAEPRGLSDPDRVAARRGEIAKAAAAAKTFLADGEGRSSSSPATTRASRPCSPSAQGRTWARRRRARSRSSR